MLALGERGEALPNTSKSSPTDALRPFLARHCQECHGAARPKGDLRIDRLSTDFDDRGTRARWAAVLKRVQAGEMPPKGKPRPTAREVESLTRWIEQELKAAEARRAGQGRTVLRRLNRVEYENTIRDLLLIEVDLKDLLPADGAAHGFDNVGEALHTSSFLMERYLEAADTALQRAIANEPRPPLFKHRYLLKDERTIKNPSENVYLKREGEVVTFTSSPWQSIMLWDFYRPDRGRYRFRISASAYQSGGKPVTYRVDAGQMGMVGKNHLVGYFDAPPDKPRVVEFIDYLEARATMRVLPYGLAAAHHVHKVGAESWKEAGLAVQWIDVEGPLHDVWPPASHRRIFGELPQAKAPAYNFPNRVEVVSKEPLADAERILRAFARRAFRRRVTEADVRPLLATVKARLAQGQSFEQAVRVGLMGVLLSPEFLFLKERPGQLDDFALASRLSYFLWSSMPDDELLALAEAGKLSDPGSLHAQVERMLHHPKAAAFTENFLGQWLGLRDIDFTEPSHVLYPEYDAMLRESMLRETHLFFDEVLKNDLSLTNFVASDFAMLNGRLARHYGIPGPVGWEFRKVKLPPDSHRGGLLTMASVHKVTANGTSTSPVTRGAWVLDRILGTPPPKPPADVPALEPDIRGATTIREQLARHRQVAACATCHVKIDPPGFALECFDVIGGYREHYRTTGHGEAVVIEGRRMPYHKGRKVDCADVLPDGRRFANIDEFKTHLLRDKEQLARSLTEKLLIYATGAIPQPTDREAIDAMVRKVAAKNYGVRSLVHEIVQSQSFKTK